MIPAVFLLAGPEAQVRATAHARVARAQALARDTALLKAVAARNAAPESASRILAKDTAWPKDPALRRQVVDAPCSARLRDLTRDDALIVEAFAMDDNGGVVCSAVETSDYWQGDESKWRKTFQEGKEAFVDEPAYDASARTYAIQLSVPVVEAGRRIGALTLTLKLRAPTGGR